MIKDYLVAGYQALCVLTHEPHRIDEVLPFADDKRRFYSWDCIRGARSLTENKVAVEVQDPGGGGKLARPAKMSLKDMERTHIQQMLAENDWNIARSAKLLEIDRITLYSKIKKYDLQKDG